MGTSSKLFDMLSLLASDSNQLTLFQQDPGTWMTNYGLPQAQIDMILNAIQTDPRQQDFLKAVGDEARDCFGQDFIC